MVTGRGMSETLEDLADGIEHAQWVVKNHVPINYGAGRTRCPLCDQWHPCELVSLAALAVLKHNELEALLQPATSSSDEREARG